jgi:hypothetical protein
MDILHKKSAVIIIYELEQDDDYFSLDINKNYGSYSGKFEGILEFQDEINSLNIKLEYDEYIYEGYLNRDQLKNELERRG